MSSDPSPLEPPRAAPPSARAFAPVLKSPSRWSILRIVALVLTIGGCVVCVILLRLGFGGGPVLGANLCTPSQSVNCDFVLASRWAKVGSMPTSALGLVYFLGLAAWMAIVGFPNRAGRVWHLIPLGTATVGLAASIYYVYVMAVHLPVWCTWCLAVHGVNVVLFLAMLGGWPRRTTAEALAPYPSAGRALGVMAGCGGFMVLIVAVVVAVGAQMTAAKLQAEFLKIANTVDYIEWRWQRADVREILSHPDDLSIGPADAANTIVVFFDFQCASCAGFHRFTPRWGDRLKDLRIVFKHYPMSRACNAHVNEGFHYFACEAARAVEAARIADPSRGVAFMGRVFEHSERLDERPYESIARSVGIDPVKFADALASPESAQGVAEDIELAHSLGIDGTPAVFLNGKKLWNWNLLTNDPRPQVDLEATDALWERLLGPSPPKATSAPTSAKGAG